MKKGAFMTPGIFRLVILVYLVYVLVRHPIRNRMYATLGAAIASMLFAVCNALWENEMWVMYAMHAA